MAKGKKTGGRAKGTPNKVTSTMRENIKKVLDPYFQSEQFAQDIGALPSKERLDVVEKFTAYVVPKLQSTTLDVKSENTITIEDKLAQLAADNDI